jgi:hypothetical protein
MSSPVGQTERTGVLVIRAWIEPEDGTLRARITQVVDLSAPDERVSVAVSEDAILDEVGTWLRALRAGEP